MDTVHYRQLLEKIAQNSSPTGADIHKFMSRKATILSGLKLADVYFEQGNTEKGVALIKKMQLEISNFASTFPRNSPTSLDSFSTN
jgi:hypothetical protein